MTHNVVSNNTSSIHQLHLHIKGEACKLITTARSPSGPTALYKPERMEKSNKEESELSEERPSRRPGVEDTDKMQQGRKEV